MSIGRLTRGQYAIVGALPECDFCNAQGARPTRTARYDFVSAQGAWANGCRQHYFQHRAHKKLGVGLGQRLFVTSEVTA